MERTRREFLEQVGRGMVLAGMGPALMESLDLGTALADQGPGRLRFGRLESLVDLMQETGPDRLLPILVDRLRTGTGIRDLVAAAALANVRCFGGEDYVGFHTMMALAPAYHMACELPAERQPLPVLKVLHRNSKRIQEKGGEVLRTMQVDDNAPASAQAIRDAVRRRDLAAAERSFAIGRSPVDALNDVLLTVEDDTEVHRIVMVYRAWDMLDLVGKEQAQTVLRQSLHYCVDSARRSSPERFRIAQETAAKLIDKYKLLETRRPTKEVDDGCVDRLGQAIFTSTPPHAAEAAAAALADGINPKTIGEAIALAANQLVLRDNGRDRGVSPEKPAGSVHGDGIGVHACDSANAWRNIAMVANDRHRVVCLLLGAYQVALDRTNRGGDFLTWKPYPREDARKLVKSNSPEELIRETEAAIRANDQPHVCAAVERYGSLGAPAAPVFDLLRRYAVSEDGALHAEKYYRTASEEFQSARPAFRWRQLVALARVTASAYGRPAPGYAESCRLLGV